MQVRPILPLLAVIAVAADAPPPAGWHAFKDDALGVAFHYPETAGLRFAPRDPTCLPSETQEVPLATESTVVVTRAIASLAVLAANLGFVRNGDQWQAQGASDTAAHASTIAVNGWHALLAIDARSLVFDLERQRPVAHRQWRLVAVGPGRCPPVLMGIATGLKDAWDSATVAAVLAGTRARR